MKADPEHVLRTPGAVGRGGLPVIAMVIGVWVLIIAVYRATATEMVAIWNSSGNYGHCWAVLPIAAWMVWTRRHAIDWSSARPTWLGAVLLLPAGAAWFTGEIASVGSVQQFALVIMLQLAAVSVLGWSLSRRLAYPIVFLLFLVPTGDFLTPWLIDRTADFTVMALKWTGVPVFREGNDLTIPSGRWSVVEACSGTRYLVASMMAGMAFAYLQFQQTWKRAVFFVVSIIVPLVANWVRAYLIVLLGHLTSNEYATGADHLVYGAVLFAVIIFILFAIGNRYRDPEPADIAPVPSLTAPVGGWKGARPGVLGVVLVAALTWAPLAVLALERLSADGIRLERLAAPSGWTEVAEDSTLVWRPVFTGARGETHQTFRQGDKVVGVSLGYFAAQKAGAELITQAHAFALGNDHWRTVTRGAATVGADGAPIRTAVLQGAGGRIAIRTWYWIDGRQVISDYAAKALTALDVVSRGRDDAAVVVIYSNESAEGAPDMALERFVTEVTRSANERLASARP